VLCWCDFIDIAKFTAIDHTCCQRRGEIEKPKKKTDRKQQASTIKRKTFKTMLCC